VKNMGWSNYLVVPRLKLIFNLSRSIDNDMIDELLEDSKKLGDGEDAVYVCNWTPKNISNKPIKDVAEVLRFYETYVGMNLHAKVFCLWMRIYDSNAYILSGAGDEPDKLVQQGYKKVKYEGDK
jgi:hypothetical protein